MYKFKGIVQLKRKIMSFTLDMVMQTPLESTDFYCIDKKDISKNIFFCVATKCVNE